MPLTQWNKANPPEGVKAKLLNDQIRDNNADIETFAEFGHEFITGANNGEHREGSAVIFSRASVPLYKEDGATPLDVDDVGRRLWYDTSTTPAILKVMTAFDTNVFTSVAELVGMLDDDDMASPSATLPASSESIKAYITTQQALDVKLTGSTMSGVLNMGDNLISGVTDPLIATDAATKAYVDSFDNVLRATGTYTGDQESNNTSDMDDSQEITSLGFDPDEVTIFSENDTKQTFVKTSTMATTSAMGMGNDDYQDFVIEFITGGFQVNRRHNTNNQTCNTKDVVYHYIAKKHS